MTVNYTTNLSLGQPVTGTESGTWGDDVNNAVTSYLDIAIAGGLAVTVTTADVTLTITQGTSVATNIGSTTAQYAILNVSGAMTAARNLILPSSSRQYVINNACTGGFLLTVKGSATTGVTLVNGEKAHVFWTGTDYSKLSNTPGGAGTFSSITNTGLTSGRVVYSTTGGLETDSANLTFNGTTLTANTIGAFTLSGTVSGGGNQINNVIIGASTPLAGSFTTLSATGVVASTGVGTSSGLRFGGSTTTTALYDDGAGTVYLDAVLGSNTNIPLVIRTKGTGSIQLQPGGGLVGTFSSTGLAVTGTFSSTLDATINSLTVGRGAGAVATNTAVGASALGANTSGTVNASFGSNSLASNTTGGGNSAFGPSSLQGNTTGSSNTGLGYLALASNSTGSFNIAVGQQALNSNTTGIYNTASGFQALFSNTTGTQNIASGFQALLSNTTGDYNTASGVNALFSNTTGTRNTASGQSALYYNTTGTQNTASGFQALLSNTTASNNTVVGYQAGYTNQTGATNVFIGFQAGYTSNTNSDNGNTCVGAYSGFSLTTGVSNTFIGSTNPNAGIGSGILVTTGSKNTILGNYSGNQGGLDIRTASNYIVLSDGDGNPRGIFDNSGNLLVGQIASTGNQAAGGILLRQPAAGSGGSSILLSHATGVITGNSFAEFSYGGGIIGSITQSGTTAVLFNVTSDQRLKENIQDADSASSLIDSLKVRQFDWKTDQTHQRYGFVAQELVVVAPEAVHQPTDPEEMMAVDYSKLVPMLVKEVQSLRKRLTALEST